MKKWLKITLWSLFLIGMVVVAIFIKKAMDEQLLPAPEISVHAEAEAAFLTSAEILERLQDARLIFEGQKRDELNIEEVEKFIKGISQVKEVEVFQSIDGAWRVDITMRKPIARIFNNFEETFYLDSEGNVVQISPNHTARVLVVTGDVKDRLNSVSVLEIINNDSLISIRKLDDIYRISAYVCNDPLFHSLIGQIHLNRNGDFVLIPLVGDQEIIFGSAFSEQEVKDKFKKLEIFYKEAMPFEGWQTYEAINLKFDGQVVCKKKNTNE